MSDSTYPVEPTYTPGEFCAAERISRTKLYQLWREGRGPRFYFNGTRRRITHRARLDFQREREAETARLSDAATPGEKDQL